MRAALSLVGILVTLGIIAMIWKTTTLPMVQQSQATRVQAEQIAGFDETGARVTQTLSFKPVISQGKLLYLAVQWMRPRSSYRDFYGIAPGDMIEAIGPQSVRDIGDESLAKALAYEAYQRQWDLVVIRNNRRFVLPGDSALAATLLPGGAAPSAAAPGALTAAAPAAPQSAQPAAAQPSSDPQKTGNPLYDQLEAIRKYNEDK